MRVGDAEEEVRLEEGGVVVPAVPDDHVRGLGLGRREDRRVVDAREDDRARLEVLPIFGER